MQVTYYDKDDKTKTVRIGSILMLIGSLPILLELLLASMANGQTLEMEMVWYDIMPSFLPLPLLGLIILIIGGVLTRFKWRTGTLSMTDEKILITGSHFIMIPIDSSVTVTEVFKYPNQVRVKSRVYRNLILKFENSELRDKFLEILENQNVHLRYLDSI
jgi:hypothetical protein